MRWLALAVLLLPALGARPGETLILPFPGLPPGEVEVRSPFPLLLAPKETEGLLLLVVEVPQGTPPGAYPVCVRPREGKEVCRQVEVEGVRALRRQVPREVFGLLLRLFLENRGNLSLGVRLEPREGSEVGFPPLALSLAPGEAKEVALPLSNPGLLMLRLSWDGEEEVYGVRVLPEGGGLPPYLLTGRVEGGYPLALRFSLEGNLSREVGGNLLLALGQGFRLGVKGGGFSLLLQPPSSFRVGYGEGAWEADLAYPWALEGRYEAFRFRLSPEALGLGYADGTFGLSATLALSPLRPSFRLERYGTPYLYARYEGGVFLGFALPPFRGEAGWGESGGISGRLGVYGSLGEGLTYLAEGGFAQGPVLFLGLGWARGPLNLALRGGMAGGAWDYGVSLAYREDPLSLEAALAPGGLSGLLEWRQAPYALRLEGRYREGSLSFALSGAYAFRLAVPEAVTLALGGYEAVRVEGRVQLLDTPLAGARVEGPLGAARSEAGGRFVLYLPKAGGRVRVLPPPGVLAFPREEAYPGGGEWVLALSPASGLRLVCLGPGQGAYLVGPVGLFLACGQRAVVPPGRYRLLPQGEEGYRGEEASLELNPLEEAEARVAFAPVPRELLGEASLLEVALPRILAPGEAAWARGKGLRGLKGVRVLARREEGEETLLLFQVPWEAREGLEVVLQGEGGERRLLLPLDPGRDLLSVRLDPPRASPGETVRVRVEVLFPAEEVHLLLPTGDLSLRREGEGPPWIFVGTFQVEEALLGEARSLTGSLRALSLQVRARQGEVERGKEVRLLLR